MAGWLDISMSAIDDNIPDRMKQYAHTKIDNILDKEIKINDFELYTSKNSKYSDDNKLGVHIIVNVISTGETFRVSSHAKPIVRAFKRIKDLDMEMPNVTTKFHKETTTNGNPTIVFKDV